MPIISDTYSIIPGNTKGDSSVKNIENISDGKNNLRAPVLAHTHNGEKSEITKAATATSIQGHATFKSILQKSNARNIDSTTNDISARSDMDNIGDIGNMGTKIKNSEDIQEEERKIRELSQELVAICLAKMRPSEEERGFKDEDEGDEGNYEFSSYGGNVFDEMRFEQFGRIVADSIRINVINENPSQENPTDGSKNRKQ